LSATRDWGRLGCAALLAASIAFPLGVLVGAGGEPSRVGGREARRPEPASAPTARNAYSPRVATDPYVIERQLEVVKALESSCRQSGRLCAEARQARLRIEEAESDR
jgi:hypothetical protein